jgi:flavin-dependent dehydrogenase
MPEIAALSHDARYDVVVVGGRVAGASTALLLARAGHRVAVVDRVRFPSDTLSTHLIWPAGVHLLRRWGLLDGLVEAGTPPLRSIRSDVDGCVVEVPVWAESGVDAVYSPRRTLLDASILAEAERAGAAVHEGVTVDGLGRGRDGRVDGVVCRRGGRAVHVGARIVVGADGWRSRVAREAGAATYDSRTPSNAIHYAYWAGLDQRGVELWYRTSGLMAGAFPTNGGTCVFVNCRPDLLRDVAADVDRGYSTLLAQAAPDLAARLRGASRTSAVRGTPGLPGALRRPHGPGWVLVGDAGVVKDPASAHGITAALHDADLAARAIDTALREPALADDAMRAFHHARDVHARPLYDLGWAMASYEWDAAELVDLQIRFAAALVDEAVEVERRATGAGR